MNAQASDDDHSLDLFWHALNYRTAATEHAEAAWVELQAVVARLVGAEGFPNEDGDIPFPEAERLARLWGAGKLVGGDSYAVCAALLRELDSIRAAARRMYGADDNFNEAEAKVAYKELRKMCGMGEQK